MKRLTIIIVSFNTKEYIKKCLASIINQMQDDWEIIVVDNDSSDDSVEFIEKHYPFVKLIKNEKNLGFAAANNIALKKLRSPYVLLLNADAELQKERPIEAMMVFAESHPEVGVMTPKILLDNGKLDEACHRGVPNPWNALMYFSGLEKIFGGISGINKIFGGYHQTWLNRNTIHEVPVCSGAAMLVRKKAMDQVGFLDERFFFYAEDIDWCVSFAKKGWKIVYYPQTVVLHHKSKAGMQKESSSEESKKARAIAKNAFFDTMKQFFKKHYKDTYPKWFLSFVFFGIDMVKVLKGAQDGIKKTIKIG